jgi:predicted nucleic acid-binding protein
LHAPHLLSVEVAPVLRRYAAAGAIGAAVAADALIDLAVLDIERYEHEPFLGRVWELRENLTAYDAVYVALAETLAAPLLTFDARLAASPVHHATIELLQP